MRSLSVFSVSIGISQPMMAWLGRARMVEHECVCVGCGTRHLATVWYFRCLRSPAGPGKAGESQKPRREEYLCLDQYLRLPPRMS